MHGVRRDTSFEFERLRTRYIYNKSRVGYVLIRKNGNLTENFCRKHVSPTLKRDFRDSKFSTVFKKSRFTEIFSANYSVLYHAISSICSVQRGTCTSWIIHTVLCHPPSQPSSQMCNSNTRADISAPFLVLALIFPPVFMELRRNFMFSSVFPILRQQCFGIQGIKHVIRGRRTLNEKSCRSQKPTCLEFFPGSFPGSEKGES